MAPPTTVSLPPPPPTATATVSAAGAPTAAEVASSIPAAKPAGPVLTADAVIESIFALPEVKAFAAAVERVSKNKAHLSMWVESQPPDGCRAGSPECRYEVYVGEHHPDHMARWQTFLVDPSTREIWVANIAGDEPDTYEVWRRRVRETHKELHEMRKLPPLPPVR